MKKALLVVAVVALVAWVILWFRTPEAVATSGARPWPGGMGTLDAVADRLPPLQANDASVKLTALANALPKNDAIDDFVRREIARGELTIGEPLALPGVSASCYCASRSSGSATKGLTTRKRWRCARSS